MESEYERSWLGQKFYQLTTNLSKYLVKYIYLYYILQFTWGILMNILGFLVFLVLIICGKKPHIFDRVVYFEVGSSWGGFSIGIFFVKDTTSSINTSKHEYGHSYQNAIYGVLWPFIVGIPSAIRYWYRKMKSTTTSYYKIWFEESASKVGEYAYNYNEED